MNTGSSSINICLPVNSLEAYIQYANKIPLLNQEEEYDLTAKLKERDDLEAARRLILPHLRYVIRIAKNYMGYGLPLADLIQEGNIGLMKAVKRFDPERGVRLVTFAVHWIKAEIHEFILRNWRIVKIATTKAQRKLFFNLRHMKKHLDWMTREEINKIANELSVKPETVREMEMRLTGADTSFDACDHEHEYSFAPAGFLEDRHANPAQQLEQTDWLERSSHTIYQALEKLDDRSQAIIRARWLNCHDEKNTLQELANKYHVSAERIRQLEKNAMGKLRAAIEEVES
jgi:RNA polymerase sigma-32 factor